MTESNNVRSPSSEGRGTAIGLFDRAALYIIPFTVAGIVFVPIAFLLITALSVGPFRGLDTNFTFTNVLLAYTDAHLLAALRNSLILGAVVAVISTALAIPMAWLLVRTDTPGRRSGPPRGCWWCCRP